MIHRAVACLAIAACFTTPERPSGLAPDDDAGTIGDGQDASPATCVHYSFAIAPAGTCGGWGLVVDGSGTISSDQLHLTAPSSASTTSARCQSDIGSIRRATLDIDPSALPADLTPMRLAFYVSIEGVRYGGELSAPQGTASLQVTCGTAIGATMPWYPSQRYVRLTVPAANKVTLQLSVTGASWDTIGDCTVPSSSTRVGLEVLRVGAGTALTASFESLEICR